MPSSNVATLDYTYCVQADVEDIMSVVGAALRLDDSGDRVVDATEQRAMTYAIIDATETINYYCFVKYATQWLATSNFINRACAVLAAYALCKHALNSAPESLVNWAAEYEHKLQEVRDGQGLLPNIPLRRKLAPQWSFTRIVPWPYQFRVIRVERQNSSTDPRTRLQQNTDYQESYSIDQR